MLTYNLDNHSEDPLYVRLYKCIRHDIESGTIEAHEKLPSKRSLARHLGLGVITVEAAYAQLIAEGYVYAQNRRGYFACEIAASPQKDAHSSCSTVNFTTYSIEPEPLLAHYARYDLSSGSVPADAFPFNAWAKTLRDTLSLEPKTSLLAAGDPRGTKRLRNAIAKHLLRTRGLEAHPDRIIIGAGAQVLYNLIIQLLGKPRCVALEDPGYGRLARIYESNEVPVAPIALDRCGIRIDMLRASQANVAHITPSHQFPTGIVMPASRRYELLGWATEQPGRYIIEDDYDCEFRLAGKPVSTLQSIDQSERVIYTNTFAKTLGSAFRVAYMVLPDHLSRIYQERMGFYSCTVPAIDQLALARFMEHGELERHISRTKTRCRNVRNALIETLGQSPIAAHLSFENIDSGLHFIMSVQVPHGQNPSNDEAPLPLEGIVRTTENAMVEALARKSVSIRALSSYRFSPDSNKNGGMARYTTKLSTGETVDSLDCRLVVSYAGLSERTASEAAEAIFSALEPFISRRN